MDDERIVDLYWERSESAITETDKKYGRYCRYIASNILHDDEDAQEIVNDTYLKTWSTIPPNRPRSLKLYVGTISRRLSINRCEAQNAKKRSAQMSICLDELTECIPDTNSENIVDVIALRDALNRFIASIPEKSQRVFVRRYWYAGSISEIANEYSMKESAVSVLLLRIRRKLKTFLQKEGFTV